MFKKIASLLLCLLVFIGGISFAVSGDKSATAENSQTSAPSTITLDENYTQNEYLDVVGRTHYDSTANGAVFLNSGSGVIVRFTGTQLSVNWYSGIAKIVARGTSYFSVFVDGETDSNAIVVHVANTDTYQDKVVVSGLAQGEHTVQLLKRTASNAGECFISSLTTDGFFLPAVEDTRLKIEVYGDSITVGSGILRDVHWDSANNNYYDDGSYHNSVQNVFQSYIGYAAKNLNARLNVYGRGGIAMKYGGTGANNIVDNYAAIHVDANADELPYDYSTYTPDVVVIGLGTNDYNLGRQRGVYSIDGLKAGFIRFIRDVIGKNYGKDIPILLFTGQMAKAARLPEHMLDIVNILKNEFPNIMSVGATACYVGHPIAEEGEVEGRKVSDAISAKLQELQSKK